MSKTAGNEPNSSGFKVYTVINSTTSDSAILNENRISNKNAGIGKITIPRAAITKNGVPKPESALNFCFFK